jgi:MOSC domain-containing protein YiiM
MKLASVNVGLPRDVMWHGRSVTTGIYKKPVEGRVTLRKLNLDGDRQADLSVHGGEYKAVYCYPLAHYEFWKKELPGKKLPMGSFGENFTIDGDVEGEADGIGERLWEEKIYLGDVFSVGTAEVMVTQPRLPCYKLGVRFGSDDMVKRFFVSKRTGFYVAVTREGEVGVGDVMKAVEREPNKVPVSEIMRLYSAKRYNADDIDSLRRALRVEALPESWKEYFRERLEAASPA